MAGLDEVSRRRPEFAADSVPIRLADGQEWHFPKPWVEIRGRFEDGRPVATAARTTFGRALDEGVDLVRNAETNHALIVGTLLLGAHMLRLNYDLSDAELEDLFVFRFDDGAMVEASLAMVREIADVAMGRTGDQSFPGGNG